MYGNDNNYKKLSCPQCGKVFFSEPREYYLNYHRVLHHGADLPAPNRMSEYQHNGFERLVERARDHTRDNVALELRSIGVDAELIDRGLPEEKSGRGSLGLILIRGSLIRWINVRREAWGDSEGGPHNSYYVEYAIPDSRPLPRFLVRSTFKKTFPLFGQVTDACWEGDKKKLGIAEKLESNEYIRYVVMRYRCGVEVVTSPKYACWLIIGDLFYGDILRKELSIYYWQWWERITECLLSVPLT